MDALSFLQDAVTATSPYIGWAAGALGIFASLRQLRPRDRRRVVRTVRGRQCAGAASR